MVFLEIIPLFSGWNYRLLNNTTFHRVLYWYLVLPSCIRTHRIHYSENHDLGRSYLWLAIAHLYYQSHRWLTDALYRGAWALSFQNLSGVKKETHLYCAGRKMR